MYQKRRYAAAAAAVAVAVVERRSFVGWLVKKGFRVGSSLLLLLLFYVKSLLIPFCYLGVFLLRHEGL